MFKNPVKYSFKDYRSIVKMEHNWDHKDADDVKIPIELHIREEFDKKCFYCQTRAREGYASGQTEHIVHKSEYKLFTFRPENLVFSCPKCNTLKSTNTTLEINLRGKVFRYKDYPTDSVDYTIVHAYFDDYHSHIELIDNIFYAPKDGSVKGVNTIKMFSLHRLQLAEDKANDMLEKLEMLDKFNFKYLFREGTDKEIKERTESILKMPLESAQEFFSTIASLTGNKMISDLVQKIDKVSRTETIEILSKKNLNFLNCFYSQEQYFKHYVNLYTNIDSNNKLQQNLIRYLNSHGFTTSSTDKKFCFNEESLHFLINTAEDLESHIDGRSFSKVKRQLCLIPNTKKDIRRLLYFHKELEKLSELWSLLYAIKKNKKIMGRIHRITPDLLENLNSNLGKIKKYIHNNPQLIIVSKLDILYQIKDLDTSIIKSFITVLESCPRIE